MTILRRVQYVLYGAFFVLLPYIASAYGVPQNIPTESPVNCLVSQKAQWLYATDKPEQFIACSRAFRASWETSYDWCIGFAANVLVTTTLCSPVGGDDHIWLVSPRPSCATGPSDDPGSPNTIEAMCYPPSLINVQAPGSREGFP